MKINPISNEAIKLLDATSFADKYQSNNNINFSDFLSDSLVNVNQSLFESSQAIEKLALGEIENTHDVIIAMEKAKLSLQLAVEVRNKLLESYKEILRMQI